MYTVQYKISYTDTHTARTAAVVPTYALELREQVGRVRNQQRNLEYPQRLQQQPQYKHTS